MNQSKTTLILFGGTGDLAYRKLIPSLFDLYLKNSLPKEFSIVGFSRKDLSNEEYREQVKTNVENIKDEFLEKITYCSGDILEENAYGKLSSFLKEQDGDKCSNKLYYLAVQPNLYKDVFKRLSESGLVVSDGNKTNCSRILIEKPFGFDRDEAKDLDKLTRSLFNEDQIYRIDHYLGKEPIQNILNFRFSNSIFEPLWNREYIDRIEIKINESLTVSNRGSFYDSIGALRDIGQNHALQMLALVTMDNPVVMEQNLIRKKREDVLNKVSAINKEGKINVTRGQYIGYREVEGVQENSQTETYFNLELFIDNDRWKDVPIIIESGKGFPEKNTEINIYFKKDSKCIPGINDCNYQNILNFNIYPREDISLKFRSKKPGFTFETEEKGLTFNYDKDSLVPDAYEKILYDAVVGDQTLFTSTKEVMAEWNVIMPVLEYWSETDLLKYEVGSDFNK